MGIGVLCEIRGPVQSKITTHLRCRERWQAAHIVSPDNASDSQVGWVTYRRVHVAIGQTEHHAKHRRRVGHADRIAQARAIRREHLNKAFATTRSHHIQVAVRAKRHSLGAMVASTLDKGWLDQLTRIFVVTPNRVALRNVHMEVRGGTLQ